MKESKERKKEECIQICSFCNKNLFETKNIIMFFKIINS